MTVQDLANLDPLSSRWKLLRATLHKVRITVDVPVGRRSRPIKDLVPRGGLYTFKKGDRTMTVKVGLPGTCASAPVKCD